MSRREFLAAAWLFHAKTASFDKLRMSAHGEPVEPCDLCVRGPSTWNTRRRVHAHAGQESTDTRPGRHALKLGEDDRDGLLYIPQGYKADVAAPLLLMLHGAGNTSQSTAYAFPLADEFGVVLLAPDSRDERTWDGVLRNWGPDVEFIAKAFRQTRGRVNVDRRRLGVAGFSDGASYALSFGISYGDDFGRIIAMSPGVMQPIEARGKPKIFISHGTSDQVMPIDETSRRFVPRLKALGYDVTYREYDGRHAPSAPIVREAFEWFLR